MRSGDLTRDGCIERDRSGKLIDKVIGPPQVVELVRACNHLGDHLVPVNLMCDDGDERISNGLRRWCGPLFPRRPERIQLDFVEGARSERVGEPRSTLKVCRFPVVDVEHSVPQPLIVPQTICTREYGCVVLCEAAAATK